MEASNAQQKQQFFPGHAGAPDFGPSNRPSYAPEWPIGHLDCGQFDEISRLRVGGGADSPVSRQSEMNEFFGNASLHLDLFSKLNLSEPLAEAENDDLFGSMEELESHAIGKLLPDDEDDLLAEISNFGRPNGGSEEEFVDVFNSGGGLELDVDPQNGLGSFMNGPTSGTGLGLNGGSAAAILAGEHPYGEHPSRTLFVRNINSNVEDLELRALFEQYGAIRTLYTACKHRGFVMISYYDIRAARTAMRSLQNKPLRRRKLDIHFSIPKDNPSDKDVNQGTLVVFNLDSSVSNDELRQIFGVYGEIKEIRETPHKKHHKFIEFYDVRAAEAALRALNRSDIAGKRIKLEPSRPGGARRSLMQQLTHELEQEEFRCQQIQNSLAGTSPGGHHQWGPAAINKLNENGGGGPLSPSSFGAKALNGVVGSLPTRVSSPLRNGIVTNQGSRHESLLQQGLRLRQQQAPLLPDLDSPTYPPLDGFDGPHLQRSLSGFDRGLKNGHSSLWNNSNSYYPGSPPVMFGADRGHFQSVRDFPSVHSSSFSERSFMDGGHNGFLSELSDRWPAALRLNGSNGSHILGGSGHLIPPKGLVESPRLGVMSPQHRARSFPNGGLLDSFTDRAKTRRSDGAIAQAENKKYQLDLERILRGEDTRTTLMIKNIPNKYTSKMLLSTIDEHHRGTYDFIYLPIDFKNKCNVGYAFINMIEPSHIVPFYQSINGKKWEKFNSEKVASLAYARIQGKNALIAHFQNSSLMNEDKRCRPILFHSEGPNLGDPEPFPVGSNVRTRPGRDRNGVCHYDISSSSDSVSSCSSKDDENGELDLGHCSDGEKD